MSRHRARLAALALPLALVSLAACGSDDDDASDTAAPGTTAATATVAPTTAAAGTTAASGGASATTVAGTDAGAGGGTMADAAASISLADTSLGKVLVDGNGMTLYLFTKDTEEASACEGECLVTWPPLSADEVPTAGEGIDAAELSLKTGGDGKQQVAYHGHLLYLFAPDEKPGDVTGQGVGDVWFAVDADGNAVEG